MFINRVKTLINTEQLASTAPFAYCEGELVS